MNSILLNRTVLHFIVSCVLWRSMIMLYVFHYLFHLNSKQTQPIINPLRRHAIRSCSYLLKRLKFYNKIMIYIYLLRNNITMTNKSKVIWPGRITRTRKVSSAYTIFTEKLTGREQSFDRMLFFARDINNATTEHICVSLIISLRSCSDYILTVSNCWLLT